MATNPSAGPVALKPTFERNLDAIKWVIGLPVAILFGTTQFAEKIDFAKHPHASSLFGWIIVVNAAAVVLSIWYYFEESKWAYRKSQGLDYSPTALYFPSYYGGFVTVAVGFLLAVVGLVYYPAVQFEKNPPPAALVSHYGISISGPVRDRMGTHVHTFLVNETTGEVWQMECETPSSVQFLRVPVQGLPSSTAKDLVK